MITEADRAQLRALANRVRANPDTHARPFRLLAALVDENDELRIGAAEDRYGFQWIDARSQGFAPEPLTRKACCGAPWDAPHRPDCTGSAAA